MGILGDVKAVGEARSHCGARPNHQDSLSPSTAAPTGPRCALDRNPRPCAREREAEGDLRDQSWARRTGASEQAEQPGGRKGARAARAASNGRWRDGAEAAKNEAVDAGERDDEMKREKKEEEEEEGERERIESFGDGRTFERSTLQAAVVGHSRARRDGD
jgi:hypothetical protein